MNNEFRKRRGKRTDFFEALDRSAPHDIGQFNQREFRAVGARRPGKAGAIEIEQSVVVDPEIVEVNVAAVVRRTGYRPLEE